MKLIITLVKKLIIAFLLLYGLNITLSAVNFYIPLNIITVSTVTVLGIPGLLVLIAMFFII